MSFNSSKSRELFLFLPPLWHSIFLEYLLCREYGFRSPRVNICISRWKDRRVTKISRSRDYRSSRESSAEAISGLLPSVQWLIKSALIISPRTIQDCRRRSIPCASFPAKKAVPHEERGREAIPFGFFANRRDTRERVLDKESEDLRSHARL